MNDKLENQKKIMNLESSFTELLSLLKRYITVTREMVLLGYQSDDLQIFHHHINSAIEVLLKGLQNLGYLMGVALSDKKTSYKINQLGCFITALSNLTEALRHLQLDAIESLYLFSESA